MRLPDPFLRKNGDEHAPAASRMPVVRKLNSLETWQTSRALARAAYRLTLDEPLSRQFGLADQIRRAAASIPANIAEGYALGTTSQFVRCLRIALGSTTELVTHLELVSELELAPLKPTRSALELANKEVGLLIGLLRSLGARPSNTLPSSPVPLPS